VTVVLPSRQRHYGPQISALPNVRVLEHAELTVQAFADAGVRSARALAVVWQDDVGNLHAGLRAQELNPGLRLVLAIFNRRLGDHIRLLFPDCTVLSGTAMSAPSFVAAALGEPAPSHVRVQRRTLYVARPSDVTSGHVICGLAEPTDDPAAPRLVPPETPGVDLVLAVADGTPRNPLTRRRDPVQEVSGLLRRLVWHKFGLVFAALLAVTLVGLPVVIGDAFREETLRAAGLDTCIALVSVTSQDIVNLETALDARTLREDVRIVLRLTDDDLAERLQKTISNTVSRSVPYLAAPAFATAMLEHQVLRTIAVGRHVLLIAEVRVADQVGLAGSSVRDTERPATEQA